jgi:predicted TPR repeat methyltransferase
MNRRERRAKAKSAARAIIDARAAVEKLSDPGQLVAVGQQLFASGNIALGRQAFERALQLAPGHRAARAGLAYALGASGALAEAIAIYRALLEETPDNVQVLTNLAILLRKTGQVDDATACYEQALALNPNHPNTVYHYAELLSARGQRDRAFLQFMHAVRLYRAQIGKTPRLEHCADLVKLAAAELWVGEAGAALAHLDQAVALRPDYALALARRGQALIKLRRIPEAIQSLSRAAVVEPSLYECRRAIGELLIDAGDLAGGARYLAAALRQNPEDALARYFLAQATGTDVPDSAPAAYVEALFDQYAATFDHHLVDVLQYRSPEALANAVGRVAQGGPSGWTIIDLGCGTGLCGPLVKSWAALLIGVDRSSGMLERARERKIYDRLEQGDIVEALDEFAGAIDLAISADVLVYVGDLKPVFAACNRALKPGGLFAFTVEAGESDGYRLQANGRYAHSRAYVEELATANDFSLALYEQIVARYENKEPVFCHLYVLRRGT